MTGIRDDQLAIKPVVWRDVRALVALEKALFPEPWSEALIKSELRLRDSRRYTKAVEGKEILGYLGLMFVDDEIHVNTIATVTHAQGRGIACRLLLDGIDAAIARGGRTLTLEVAASNTRAQALYRRFGLAPVGVRRGYYARGEDALVMWGEDLTTAAEIERRRLIAASLGL